MTEADGKGKVGDVKEKKGWKGQIRVLIPHVLGLHIVMHIAGSHF
jgi:hypothetical protein